MLLIIRTGAAGKEFLDDFGKNDWYGVFLITWTPAMRILTGRCQASGAAQSSVGELDG